MTRLLLATCLFLFAAAAMADDLAVVGDTIDDGVKPGKATAVSNNQDSDPATSTHATVAPSRSSTPHAVAPRWHSLLPGMIR